MGRYLLTNAVIVTGASSRKGTLGIDGERISGIWYEDEMPGLTGHPEVIDLGGKVLMAGGIDAHVHFREPGMTWKADIASESKAALLGGITSFIDMPNTTPPTVSLEALHGKSDRAAATSAANYGFHIGATNANVAMINEYLASGLGEGFAGIKIFMGSSTGNMLVDREAALRELFRINGKPILVHSEDEVIIRASQDAAKARFGTDIPFREHPVIRSREACIKSTRKALELACEYGTALHILHVSTAEEVDMIREAKASNQRITAETSANYLWFCDEDYDRLGGRIKCNPAVKEASDREALRQGLADGTIDTIGSDHAPHLLSEKDRPYLECPSGIPSIQYSLPVAVTVALELGIPLTRIADAYSEKAAGIFGIEDRGTLKAGSFADLVVIDPEALFTVNGTASKCGWTPYEGERLRGKVEMVWLNGELAVNGSRPCTATGLSRPLPLRFRSTARE